MILGWSHRLATESEMIRERQLHALGGKYPKFHQISAQPGPELFNISVNPWCFHVVLFRAAWNVVEVIGISVASPYSRYESTNPLGVNFSKGWWNSVVSFDQILVARPVCSTRLDSFGVRNLERRMDGMLVAAFTKRRSQIRKRCGKLVWFDIRSPQVRHQMFCNDRY